MYNFYTYQFCAFFPHTFTILFNTGFFYPFPSVYCLTPSFQFKTAVGDILDSNVLYKEWSV